MSALLRELVEGHELRQPVLFKGIHEKWPPLQWTLDDWDRALKKNERNLLPCRLGRKKPQHPGPEWEWMTREAELSWKGLQDWASEDWWAVFDYKHLPHVLLPSHVTGFDWAEVGYAELNGNETNLWIGTSESSTPCHFDTYGANFVTQVRGHKEWILFPPEDRVHLCPTRVPYEESSVYSSINFRFPSPNHLKQLSKCHGQRVVLEPGDVLFVPPKWWHSVSSLDFSISLNTWIDIAEDRRSRVEESILRSLVASLLSISEPETGMTLLNPGQEAVEEMAEPEMVEIFHKASLDFLAHPQQPTQQSKPPFLNSLDRLMSAFPSAQTLPSYTFPLSDQSNPANDGCTPFRPSPSYIHHLINAIGHPDVLPLIASTFLSSVKKDYPHPNPNQEKTVPEDTFVSKDVG